MSPGSRSGQQQRRLLEVKVLAVLEAERQKRIVSRLRLEMADDLPALSAQRRITADEVRPEPGNRGRALVENLLAYGVIYSGIVISKQSEQRGSLALREVG